MTKNGFVLLVMGFTGKKSVKFKIAYIEAFDYMQDQLANGKSNASKLWRFNYYKPFSKPKKRVLLGVGKYPEMTLQQARKQRDEYLSLLAQDVDPQDHRKKQEAEEFLRLNNTLFAIAENWKAKKAKKAKEIEPLTLSKNWRRLEMYIFPTFANMPVSEILPTNVIKTLEALSEQGATDYTLKLSLRLLNEILTFAVLSGVIPFNPCQDVKARFNFGKTKNNPAIRPEELPELIHRLFHSKITLFTRNLFFWQLLTMTRPAEASNAQWSEIDFEAQSWAIPAERMKRRLVHVVPLSTQALKILAEMQQWTGDSPYIFQSPRNPQKPLTEQTINKALRDIGYSGKQTAHGLRSIASTYLNEQLINFDVIEACLSHGIKDQVRKAYNRSDYFDQRVAVMQQWGDFVESCSKGL